MTDFESPCRDYDRVARAIRFIDENRLEQPDLEAVAAAVSLSPYHFQRLFTRWAGVSPRRFLGYLTLDHARALLEDGTSVLDAALEAGLSGPGRLHDLFVTFEAVTPGEARHRGHGLTLSHGTHPSPFGRCVLAASDRGICGLAFVTEVGEEAALAEVQSHWPGAVWCHDPDSTRPLAEAAFAPPGDREGPLSLHVSGTNFQIKVWEPLMRVPPGHLVAYNALAEAAGRPRAVRAVGNALARNPMAYLIPCHRVIRQTGAFNTYRWGLERRKALVGWEAAMALEEKSLQNGSEVRQT